MSRALHIVHLDELEKAYALFLRTLRITRSTVASTLAMPVVLVAARPIIPAFLTPQAALPGDGYWRVLFLLVPMSLLIAFLYFLVHRALTAGSVTAARLGLIAVYVWVASTCFGISALLIRLPSSLELYTTLLLAALLYGGLFALLVPGFHSLPRWRRSPLFPLLCEPRTRGSFLHDVGRVLALWIPSGLRGPRVTGAILLAGVAFLLEGVAFFAYLQYPSDLRRRAMAMVRGQATHEVLLSPLEAIASLVMIALLVKALFAVCRVIRRVSRRFIVTPADQLRLNDERRPILFLRPFRDDQISLRAAPTPLVLRFLDPVAPAETLDELIFRRFTNYGPVIAIGNPQDKVPPLGCARKYVKQGEWREVVTALVEEAACVIVAVHDTDNIMWELEMLRRRGHLHKTVLVWPPGCGRNEAMIRRVSDVVDHDLSVTLALVDTENAKRHTEALLCAIAVWFDDESTATLVLGRSTSELHYDLVMTAAVMRLDGGDLHSLTRPEEVTASDVSAIQV